MSSQRRGRMIGSPPLVDRVPAPSTVPEDPNPHHPVLRNTFFLTMAQVVGIPLSVLTNALTARYLGPAAIGYMYIAASFNSLGFLTVDWGQSGALPALVATDQSRAGPLLGTSLAWRGLAAIPIYAVLIGLSNVLGYGVEVRVVLTLGFVGCAISAMSNGCQAVVMGFERVDVAAYRQILEQFAVLFIVIPILIFGGGVNAALVGYGIVALVGFLYVWWALPTAQVGSLSVDRATLQMLLRYGTPFVFLSVAMVLQPTVDATFLSKLSPAEAVGWYSASRRLIGFLIFPTGALVGALYPTLCRLHATDLESFKQTVSGALRWTAVLVFPVALGCFLYPDLGVALYDRKAFLPAENNVRVLSLFLFLLYFTMPLGACVMAAGRQRVWALVQFLCVVVSLVADPILVPWFQQRTGNGGLGLCVAGVASEVVVFGCGVALAPSGIFDRRFWRLLAPALVSCAAMVAVARIMLLESLPSVIAAPLAISVYLVCLWITGGLDREFISALRKLIERGLPNMN